MFNFIFCILLPFVLNECAYTDKDDFISQNYPKDSVKEINNPELFLDQICSYNSVSHKCEFDQTKCDLVCSCECNEYHNDYKNEVNYINGQLVHCRYKLKRQFIALFFSFFVPFGIDYFYLGRPLLGTLILFLSCVICSGNCIILIEDEKEKIKNNQNEKKKNSLRKLKIVFSIFMGLFFLFYLVNLFLMAKGLIKDGEGHKPKQDVLKVVNVISDN